MSTHAVGTSGLDVANIVSQLMGLERRPLTVLAKKEASFQAKLSAYGSIRGAVSSFQSVMLSLNNTAKFQALKATPSDSTIFSASAASTAVPGTYALTVSQLAQSQKLVAAGKATSTETIGTGTLNFNFGTITGNTLNSTTGKYVTTLPSDTTAITSGTTVTLSGSSTTANLAVGAVITGTGIADGTTIASIVSSTVFTLSATATNSSAVALTASPTFTSNGSGTKTVVIGASDNSLQGIRDAINTAKIGVTATIINDGGATPFRLSLTSNSIGKINSMKITISNAGSGAGLDGLNALLGHNPVVLAEQALTETVTAQNAEFKIDGVAVSKTSNAVSDVIQGITLNLHKVTTTATAVSLAVARDTTTVKSSVEGFVKAYNDLNKLLKDVSDYNQSTKKGAVLQGESTVRTLQAQMRTALNASIDNTGGSLSTLSQIGVTFQKDGTLALDTAKLNTAVDNNYNDIASLFATVGKVSDSLVSYSSSTSSTKPGSYALSISILATQGKLTGYATPPTRVISAAAANNVLTVTLNGVSATVTLPDADYGTNALLAAEVQSRINGASAMSDAGISVAVTVDAGVFTLTSNRYGSDSTVVVTGNGAANLLGTAGGAAVQTAGLDVAGTLGGTATTGKGQSLTANSGNASGLKILITGGATGARGTVNYSQGYAYTLNTLVTSLLATNGQLAGRTDGINSSIKDIDKQRDALAVRLDSIESRYRKQFSALDGLLSSMGQTSNYLTQQLATIRNLNRY